MARALSLFLALAACGCTGELLGGADDGPMASAGSAGNGAGGNVASGGSSGSDNSAPSFTCDESARPPVMPLRRLTMAQYQRSIADFVEHALGSSQEAEQVLESVRAPLERVPLDRREPTSEDLHGSYRRLDQSLQQLHVDAFYDVSVALGAALTRGERLREVVGDCADDEDTDNDATCLRQAIERLGERALRRPLDEEELAFYEEVYGDDKTANAAAYADVIAVMLSSPQFVYFTEHGERELADKPGVYELSSYELASRLSYQLWQTSPDQELYDRAADGSLLEADVYREQVQRLLADPRARGALDEFFADWTKAEDLPALDAKNADPVFAAFAGEDLPSAELRQAMIDDVLGLLGYYTWQEPSSLSTLLQTQHSFARSRELAKLYGVPVWDGASEPPELPPGQRPGLLTRALFLATGSPNTRPIMKGLFIRKHILCDAIPPPPPGANAKPPELEPGMTTRETVEALTETPGTVCAGCHRTLLNPLGFATEGFDALGRYRSEQRFFDAEGNEIGSKPVSTLTKPHVLASSDASAAGPAELMEQIAASGKAEACLSRNFFRYTFARWEDTAVDGCALERMRQVLAEGGSVVDLVVAATEAESFRQRAFE